MLSQGQIQAAWSPRCKGPWLTISLHGEGRITVRPAIGDAVLALDACLRRWDYRTRRADTGAYNCRPKTSGNGWSMHAFAIAPDINWTTNPYGPRLVTDMPLAMVRAICAIRTRNGKQVWNWGGFWSGNKDAMHFEIVCSPADLAHGIDPATVPGGTASRPPTTAPKPAPAAPTAPTPTTPAPQITEDPMLFMTINGRGRFLIIPGGVALGPFNDLEWYLMRAESPEISHVTVNQAHGDRALYKQG